MKKAILLLLALAIMLGVTACSQEESDTPPLASGSVIVTSESAIPTNVEPSIRGRITRINHSAEGTEILVESSGNDGASSEQIPQTFDKAIVKLDDKTALGSDSESVTTTLTSLTAGDMVEVWFSGDPTTDSYPVLAYAQAVKVITKESGISVQNVLNLPRLVATGGSSSLAVITSVAWEGASVTNSPLKELLANHLGAYVSASSGDAISLSFSMPPDSYAVSYSGTTSGANTTPLEVAEGKITVPNCSYSTVYIRVDAAWDSNRVQYAFAVNIIE